MVMGKLSIPRLALAVTVFGTFLLLPTESFARKTWLEKLFSGPQEVRKQRKPRPTAKAAASFNVVTPLTAPVPEAKPAVPSDHPGAPVPENVAAVPVPEPSPRRMPEDKGSSQVRFGAIQGPPVPPAPRSSPETPPETVPIPEPNPRTAIAKPDEMAPAGAPPRPMLPDPRSALRPDSSGQLPPEEIACRQRLLELGVKFDNRPAEADPTGCSMPYPLAVKSLGKGIGLTPSAEMSCAMAEAIARYAQDVVSPTAREVFDRSLKSISHASAYVCRPRNGTHKLSEHAFGNALDIASFTLSGGKTVLVEPDPPEDSLRFLGEVRSSACGPFKTVLGPGSPDHSEHLHFDLAPRRHGGTVCE